MFPSYQIDQATPKYLLIIRFCQLYYGLLRFTTVYYGLLRFTTVYYGILRFITVYYGLLRFTTVLFEFVTVNDSYCSSYFSFILHQTNVNDCHSQEPQELHEQILLNPLSVIHYSFCEFRVRNQDRLDTHVISVHEEMVTEVKIQLFPEQDRDFKGVDVRNEIVETLKKH